MKVWVRFRINEVTEIMVYKEGHEHFFYYESGKRKGNKRIRINNYFLSTKISQYSASIRTNLSVLGYHEVTEKIKKPSRFYVI